ncbi:MAG TPA: hypothetical protein ENN98_05105, partial [Desulfurivibrio alkaliphilus]|nr:hypothetical protein [Desulfurivibrio alkaliphilus]
MRRNGYQAGGLIEALHAVQKSYGYIDLPAMRAIADALTLPLSKVYGVATFYHFFRLKPKGRHTCVVWLGTACYIKGATANLEEISREFGIKAAETSRDGRLSLLTARCVGACGQAPAVVVDEQVIGQAEPAALLKLLRDLDGPGKAEKLGLLGNHIGGSAFHFKVEIRLGAGAFVCGEETALIASIEGKRGLPRPRPPYPAEHGLWGSPTLINNVETFANITAIINRGAPWFAAMGTAKSKGTKVFALAGKISNTGLIEVPMGISLHEIVEEMGGGAPNGGRIKAVQTGGPSGGCIPAAHFRLPVDYESLQAEGSIMGSGGMIVMDEGAGMVDVARFFMEFCVDESCGKCVPCRVGTRQILLLLEKIAAGRAQSDDLTRLEELCAMVRATSLCG